jgi:hypothetical protein
MLELERRRLTEAGKSPPEVNNAVKAFGEFYALYLTKGMSPGQIIALHPEWKAFGTTSPTANTVVPPPSINNCKP